MRGRDEDVVRNRGSVRVCERERERRRKEERDDDGERETGRGRARESGAVLDPRPHCIGPAWNKCVCVFVYLGIHREGAL